MFFFLEIQWVYSQSMSLYSKLCLLFNLTLYIIFLSCSYTLSKQIFFLWWKGDNRTIVFLFAHNACKGYYASLLLSWIYNYHILSMLSPGSCITCPWGSCVAHGRAASKPVTSEPITNVFHPYHNKAVMFALLELSHLPSWRFNPLFHLFISLYNTNAALSHISSKLSVALNNTEVVSAKQVTLANN